MVDGSRGTHGFSEHIRTMRTHLYLLLLTVGISATPLRSNLAELQTWLQQIYQSVDMLVSSIFYFCSMVGCVGVYIYIYIYILIHTHIYKYIPTIEL